MKGKKWEASELCSVIRFIIELRREGLNMFQRGVLAAKAPPSANITPHIASKLQHPRDDAVIAYLPTNLGYT